jgi:phage terminase large subunit-like protein
MEIRQIHFSPLFIGEVSSTVSGEVSGLDVSTFQSPLHRGGLFNDSWFAYVCGLDEGDDWKTDPSCWVKANPNIGVSIPASYLQKQVDEALQMLSKENIVARLNFCVWTEQATRAIAVETWNACASEYTAEDLEGRLCYGGLDLGSVSDISSLVLVFPPDDECDVWRILPFFWAPEAAVREQTNRGTVNYGLWVKQGHLIETQGNVTDYRFIRRFISGVNSEGKKTEGNALVDRFAIQEIAYDRWNATQAVIELQDDALEMVQFGQGFASMGGPTRDFNRLILSGKLRHNSNPVMNWMISNLAYAQDPAGNQKPDKEKSGEKIDGPVATVMALGRAVAMGVPKAGSFTPFCV